MIEQPNYYGLRNKKYVKSFFKLLLWSSLLDIVRVLLYCSYSLYFFNNTLQEWSRKSPKRMFSLPPWLPHWKLVMEEIFFWKRCPWSNRETSWRIYITSWKRMSTFNYFSNTVQGYSKVPKYVNCKERKNKMCDFVF